MGLLDRLHNWLIGAEDEDETTEEPVVDSDPSAASYQCSICGTGVEADAEECPLCRSTDIVPTDREADGGRTPADSAAAAEVSRTTDGSEDPAAQLRKTEQIGRTLTEYRDDWEVTDDGIRVETDDGAQVVDSREQAAALLEESR